MRPGLRSGLVAFAAAGGLAALWFLLRASSGPEVVSGPARAGGAGRSDGAGMDSLPQDLFDDGPGGGGRAVAASPSLASSSTSQTSPAHRTIEGSVVDLIASPVPGVLVIFKSEDAPDPWPPNSWQGARATSEPDGRFRLEVGDRNGVLRAGPGPWTAVFEARVSPTDPPAENLLVVAPVLSLSGAVVDERDAAVAGAQVRVELPGSTSWKPGKERRFGPENDIRSSFPLRLDRCNTARWAAASDEQGAFAIAQAPRIAGAQLVTLHAGYRPDVRDLPDDGAAISVVLRARAGSPNHIQGLVVDPEHVPAAGAWVFLGSQRTRTDPDGRFDLSLGFRPDGARLVAVKEGWMPASQLCRGDSPLDPAAWPDPLVLALGEKALAIRGQVVDAEGNGLPRCRVRAIDPVGLDEILSQVGGEPSRGEVGRGLVLGGSEVACDVQGSFVLQGLMARTYRLRAVDPSSLASADSRPIEAGRTDVRIRIETGACFPCVAGLVVDPAGAPVANMRVQARRTTSDGVWMSDEIRTDTEGRFKLQNISRDAESIAVLPECGVPRLSRIDDQSDPCSLRLVVPRNGDLLVEVTSPALDADEFAVLDGRGTRVAIAKHWGGGGWQGPFDLLPVVGGKSEWAIVPEDAVTILLLKDGNEVARRAIQVRPGELTVIRM